MHCINAKPKSMKAKKVKRRVQLRSRTKEARSNG